MAFSRGFLFEATFAKIIEAGLSRWQCSSDGNTHPAGIARSAIREGADLASEFGRPGADFATASFDHRVGAAKQRGGMASPSGRMLAVAPHIRK